MSGQGPLRWRGSKPRWPRGPLQWVLTVIGLLVTTTWIVLAIKLGPLPDIATLVTITLIYFGTLVLLSMLYRVDDRRTRT